MQLSDLVSPTPVDAFLREHCGQRFFHQPGAGGRFDGLLSWAALNRILEDHRLEPPRLRLARDGAPVPDERYAVRRRTRRGVSYPVLDPARLREELAAGATLVLDGVDELHRPVRDLAASLERELGERTQVNLYASWRERRGFGMHWDDHDVLVLQVSGRKRWRVHGATRPHPLHRDVAAPPEPTGEPVWDGLLEAGGVLHVPRGHWHDAMAGGEPSLHLTVGLIRPTGVELVAWLADRLRAVEAFRRDLPRRAGAEERRRHAGLLREALLERWPDDLLDEFLAFQDAHAEARPRLSLPWGIVDHPLDRTTRVVDGLPRRPLLLPHRDGLELRALGRSWVFAPAAGPTLALALDGRPHEVGELLDAGPAAEQPRLHELLVFLCREGVLAIEA